MDPTDERPIALTPKAIEMAKKKLGESKDPVVGLRVGVKGGGCSGASYVIELASKIREGKDIVYDFEGLSVITDPKSLELLKGATLDWETKLVGYGFKWRNPNVKSMCGCGESFST